MLLLLMEAPFAKRYRNSFPFFDTHKNKLQKNPSSQSRGGYDGLTVEVTGGKVRGKTLEGGDIDAWLGIPYAEKPIGLNLYYSFGGSNLCN